MNKTLIALWLTLSMAILALSTFAMLWWNQRQQVTKERLQTTLLERLRPLESQAAGVIDGYRLDFQKQLAQVDSSNGLAYGIGNSDRRLDATAWMPFQRDPRIHQIVVVDRDRRLVYPANLFSMNETDQGFVKEAMAVIKQGAFRPAKLDADVLLHNSSAAPFPNQSAKLPPKNDLGIRQAADTQAVFAQLPQVSVPVSVASESGSGWTSWYFGRRIVIGFWSQYSDGTLVMLTVPRSRMLADLIALLPDNSSNTDLNSGPLFRIVDSEARTLHQWGQTDLDPSSATAELVEANITLPSPLENLQLRIYADRRLQKELVPRESVLPMAIALSSFSGVLVLMGLQVTLLLSRQMRLARQQVSFVNQVSHELRTPLTNISMYAELAQSAIDSDSDSPHNQEQRSRLDVIQQESSRLNRLINNVLQLGRPDTKQLRLRPHVVDDIVKHSLSLFEPRLQEKAIAIETDFQCGEELECDADVVEQIVVNLVSNAEKYGSRGKVIGVSTRCDNTKIYIRVWDQGPGIPQRLHSKLFRPFMRASHELESPSGTGIGLSIVRQLARKHGGDCVLVPSDVGAIFECTLRHDAHQRG